MIIPFLTNRKYRHSALLPRQEGRAEVAREMADKECWHVSSVPGPLREYYISHRALGAIE